MRWIIRLPLLLLLFNPTQASDSPPWVQVSDDTGRTVSVAQPVQRIISLAPHITENLYAIGLGERIVGAVSYSDYPEAAQNLSRVGGYNQIDLEGIISKQPDLIIAWLSGNPRAQLEQLERLGLTVYYSEPRRFSDVADNLRRLGQLGGVAEHAATVADEFEAAIDELRQHYAQRPAVRVFYQIWEQPLMTINREHLINEAIETCGGVNVFADLERLAPRISREAVLERNPDVIIGGGMGEDNPAWVQAWQRWPQLTAVAQNQLFFIPPSLIQRHTLRLLQGTRLLCDQLERARRPELG